MRDRADRSGWAGWAVGIPNILEKTKYPLNLFLNTGIATKACGI